MSTPKELPILFSAPMVRAILSGTKTQTRRICKGQRELSNIHDFQLGRCPYGKPGGRLWVRETFSSHIGTFGESIEYYYRAKHDERFGPWKPSIHMPREASRINLEVTGISVERLQDISEDDAIAEGVEREGEGWKSYEIIHAGKHKGERHPHAVLPNKSPLTSYRELWESLNGKGSWDLNPFVWVVEFERIKP